MTSTQEKNYYGTMTDQEAVGSEDFAPETFIPCKGTILVVLPPPKTETEGGIKLPDRAIERPNVGRVAAIPPDDPSCPVKPGDWIVTRYMQGYPVLFNGRKDLSLLQYTDDASTEILGFFQGSD